MPRSNNTANTAMVLDFETTGLSPDLGGRAIEIGAVKLEEGVAVARFQSLMNPGFRINGFIESYTGITNKMLKTAPPCSEVMSEFAEFASGYDLVAHNASFDRRFLEAEFSRIRHRQSAEFACSMLIARRLYRDAPNHQLGTLVRLNQIPNDGTFHRALADADMTALLWLKMLALIQQTHEVDHIPFSIMQALSATPAKNAETFLKRSFK